jgi:hypothetical protein
MKSRIISVLAVLLTVWGAEIDAADVPPVQASIVKVRSFIADEGTSHHYREINLKCGIEKEFEWTTHY